MENISLYAFATPLQLEILEVYFNVLHSKLFQHPVDLDVKAFHFSLPWFFTYKVKVNGIFLIHSTAPKLVNHSV